jgi:hypothetical protein
MHSPGPLTAITGILLGSSFAIAFSLGAVLLMLLVAGSDDPRLAHEMPALLSSLLIFSAMTAVSGTSFYLLIRRHAAMWLAQAFMWCGIAAIACYYWPQSA